MRTEELRSDVDPSELLLYLTPSTGTDVANCAELQTFGTPAETNALTVTYADSASDRAAAWRSHVDAPPANFGIVVVGRGDRQRVEDIARNETRVETVPDGRDLTELGVTITRILDEWSDHPYQSVVDFDSVTSLLQYVDRETSFRFLHTLTAQLERVDAGGHFHLTPDAIDDRTYHLLRPLFDAVVDGTGDDGEVRRDAEPTSTPDA
jgi:hypothetical protein